MAAKTPDQPVSIGELREYVQFATVIDVIDPVSKRSVKQFTWTTPEHAAVIPVGTQLFYDGYATEAAVSHTIYSRYRSDGVSFQFIKQDVILPDSPDQMELMFEIIRATEWNGRRIYNRFDCRLISKQTV